MGIPFLDRIDLIGVVNLGDSFTLENEKVAPHGVQPMSCYGVLRSIGGGCGRGEVGLVV